MSALLSSVDGYLEHCRTVRRRSAHTIADYENDLRQFSAALGISEELSPEVVRRCLQQGIQALRKTHAGVRRLPMNRRFA
jgi:site-specific recombinase XerD